jgi:hypothetical protein
VQVSSPGAPVLAAGGPEIDALVLLTRPWLKVNTRIVNPAKTATAANLILCISILIVASRAFVKKTTLLISV